METGFLFVDVNFYLLEADIGMGAVCLPTSMAHGW